MTPERESEKMEDKSRKESSKNGRYETNKLTIVMTKPLLNTYQYNSNFRFEYVNDF
jgi:hypothetical protein